MEGESMSEWKEVRLGDIIDLVIDYRGKTPKKLGGDWSSSGYRALSAKNIKTGQIVQKESIRYVDESLYKRWMQEEVKRGDILITSEAPFGQIYLWDSDEKIVLSQRLFDVRIRKEHNSTFVYYQMQTRNFQSELDGRTTGTTVVGLRQPELLKCHITIPDINTQNQIAGILSSLDAKIETNNKLNEKLEEMAQAIFKSWFVDFEPFKDKPFHETELGMIPEGWEVSTFSSIIEKLISGDWGKETPTGNYVHKVACIRGCDFENIKNGLRGKTPERFIIERNFASKQPKPNDIVVEMSGGTATVSTGRICYITKELLDQYGGDIVCTNFCKIVRPLKGWSQYLYYYWQYKYDKKVMFCYENGTSGIKNFAINDFIDIESLLIPPKDELIKFNSIIDNIRVKIQMNGVENTRLASLRDTLLPRLMSGELIV